MHEPSEGRTAHARGLNLACRQSSEATSWQHFSYRLARCVRALDEARHTGSGLTPPSPHLPRLCRDGGAHLKPVRSRRSMLAGSLRAARWGTGRGKVADAIDQTHRGLNDALREIRERQAQGSGVVGEVLSLLEECDLRLLAGWDLLSLIGQKQLQLRLNGGIHVLTPRGTSFLKAILMDTSQEVGERARMIHYVDVGRTLAADTAVEFLREEIPVEHSMVALLSAFQLVRDRLDSVLFTQPPRLRDRSVAAFASRAGLAESHFRALAIAFPRVAEHADRTP